MIGRTRRALGALVAIGSMALAGCGDDGSAGAEGASDTVRLAVTDLQGLEELQREFGAFTDVLEETSGLTVEFYPVNDRVAAAAALESDQVDLVFTGPAEYVVLNERTEATPLVAINRPGYRSCLYTTADSGIDSIEDLAGETVAMSDIGSTSGHLGPSQIFVDAGMDPLEDVEVLTVGDAVHEALRRGDVAAVGVGCHDYEEFMAEEDDPSAFPILVEGEELPPDVILVRDGYDEEAAEAVRAAFEEHFDELLEAMLEGDDNSKYTGASLVDVSDSDYDVVRSMYQAIGVDDFTEFVGD